MIIPAGLPVLTRRIGRLGASTVAIFIVGTGPVRGKSTARETFVHLLGLQGMSTSQAPSAVLERERGWPAGTVAVGRSSDHELLPSDLRELGERIGQSRRPAGVRALARGSRIIDGVRRVSELDRAVRAARRRGLTPMVAWIARSGGQLDDTESEALFARADVVVHDAGSIPELQASIGALVRALRLVDGSVVPTRRLERFVAASHDLEWLDRSAFGPGSGPFVRHVALAEHLASDPGLAGDPSEVHYRLMHGLVPPEDLGRYRRHAVRIGGAHGATPGPGLDLLMEAWREAFANGPRLDESSAEHAWRLHDEFECIHPFADGNGRVGRLILNAARVRAGLPWLTVLRADRPWYHRRIRHYREGTFKRTAVGGSELALLPDAAD